jgi:hypothetical protein
MLEGRGATVIAKLTLDLTTDSIAIPRKLAAEYKLFRHRKISRELLLPSNV